MKIGTLVLKAYEVTKPYAAIASIEKRLLRNSFVVVLNRNNFVGVLTSDDIVKSPRRLVIDCLHDKPRVDHEQDIESAMKLMKESQNSVLPVFKAREFIGVVTQADITDVLAKYRRDLEQEITGQTSELLIANKQLSREIEERKRAEKALRKARDEMEGRVKKRTAELARTTKKLKIELTERRRAEKALREREAALKIRTKELQELNSALRVLLKGRDQDKTELEEKVLLNVKELVVPYVQKLKKSHLDAKQMAHLSVLESNLNDIISSFGHKFSLRYLRLTPAEIQIANLVKDGKTAKEIAELLNLSIRTIESHRRNIRAKMGLKNKKTNLRSHLLSI